MPHKGKKTRKHSPLLFTAIILIGIIIVLSFSIQPILDSNYVKQELSQIILEKTGTKVNPGRIDFKIFPRPYLQIDEIEINLKQNNKKNRKLQYHAKLIIGTALFYPDLKTLIYGRKKTFSGTFIIRNARIYDLSDAGIPFVSNIKDCSIDYLKINFTHKRKENFIADLTGEHPQFSLKNTKIPALSGKKFTLHLDISKGKTQIKLGMFKLDFPSMYISMNFLYDKNQKKSLFEISGKNVDINKIRQIALVLLKGNKVSNELFKIIRSGKTDNINIIFHGSDLKALFHTKNMLLNGTIKHGSVEIPETGLITTEITGNALVKQDILYTDIKKGHIGNSSINNAKLYVNILDHKHPFKGVFPINADLKELSSILRTLLPGTYVKHELNLCHNIKGRVKGTLILKKNEEKHISVWVNAHDINLQAEYDRIPGKISIKSGNFKYKDESSIGVDNLSGQIGKNKFSYLCAYIGLKNDHLIDIKSGKVTISLRSVFPWLLSFKKIRSSIFPLKSAIGTIYINSINLKGQVLNPEKWQYELDGSCRDINLGTDSSDNDITSLSSDFIVSDREIIFSNLHADILKAKLLSNEFSRLSLSRDHRTEIKKIKRKSLYFTETSLLNDIAFPLSISKATALFSTKKIMTFKGDILFKTGPALFITMTKKMDNQTLKKLSNFHISIKIKDKNMSDATISYTKNKNSQAFNMKGILESNTIKKILKKGSEPANKLLYLTNGDNFIIKSNKKSGLSISTNEINFNAFNQIQKRGKKRQENIYPTLFPHGFTIKSSTLVYKTIHFAPFEAKIAIDKNAWTILVQNTKLCGINITGIINKKNKSNDLNLSLTFYTKKGDLDRSISCMFGKDRLIKGNYSIGGNLKSMGSMNHIPDNFHGDISFHSSGGRIYKLTLISRILSVINIAKFIRGKLPDIIQKGFAYKFIDIKADVKKSRLFLQSAVIKGVDMTLIFKGWIDLVKDKEELTCLVSPFRTADMIIKHIPLLGHILNDRLISIPVKITGNINDPDIFLLPPSAVGKELINIMQRTLETPFRIIKLIP